MNGVTYQINGFRYKSFQGRRWKLLLHHNSNGGKVFFDNATEAFKSFDSQKYSILYTLDDRYRTMKNGDSKFEFIVEWPEDLKYYFHWRQSMNPLNDYEETNIFSAKGFEPIHNGTSFSQWGGLVRDRSCKYSYLNGVPGVRGTWCIAIGMYGTQSSYIGQGIPAACDVSNTVDLWVKLPLSFSEKAVIKRKRLENKLFVIVLIILK